MRSLAPIDGHCFDLADWGLLQLLRYDPQSRRQQPRFWHVRSQFLILAGMEAILRLTGQ